MNNSLNLTVDKFRFTVPTDRYYSEEGVWALPEGDQVRVGLSDYLQQSSGDVGFATVVKIGTSLRAGQEIASIETIKVTIALGAPVAGTVLEVNPTLDNTPEVINTDPYGEGWLAVMTPSNWEEEKTALLAAPTYFARMKAQAEEEAKRL